MPVLNVRKRARCSPFTRNELIRAARHVMKNRQAAGLDGLLPRHLSGEQLGRMVHQLYKMLDGGRWRPMRARRGIQPRPPKPPRIHSIASLRDATVQRAAVAALEDVWKHLPAELLGGRPGGRPHAIIRAIVRFLARGGGWVLRFDVRGAFARAPFAEAIAKLRTLSKRHDVLDVVEQWRFEQGSAFAGLVEGSAVAMLLLAVLLQRTVEALRPFGAVFVWVDDGVLLCRDEATARAAEAALVAELGELGLEPHPKKTGIYAADTRTAGPSEWDFLGFRFRGWLVEPLPTAVNELLTKVTACLERDRPEHVRNIVDGWTAYYVQPSAYLEVLIELEATLWPWGPFRKPSATNTDSQHVALRGPKGPRAGRVTLPGVSGGFLP